jgi:hypothetical protein
MKTLLKFLMMLKLLGLIEKVLTVQHIPGDSAVKISKTPSVETRRSVDTAMLSSLNQA